MPPRPQRQVQRPRTADVVYDDRFFRGLQQERDFEASWRDKKPVIERRWILLQFRVDGYHWQQEFEQRGWVELAAYSGVGRSRLSQEFAANVSSIEAARGAERLVTWVRDVEITVTPDTFAEIFHLPRVQDPEFDPPGTGYPAFEDMVAEIVRPGEQWIRAGLSPRQLRSRYIPLFLWMCYSVIPIQRTSEVSRARGFLMWAIGTGRTIDMPRLLFLSLADELRRRLPRGSIPFGGFISEVCQRAGVYIPDSMITTDAMTPISLATIHKGQAQLDRYQAAQQRQHPPQPPPPPPPQPEPEQQQPEPQPEPQPGQQQPPTERQMLVQLLRTVREQSQLIIGQGQLLEQQRQALDLQSQTIQAQGATLAAYAQRFDTLDQRLDDHHIMLTDICAHISRPPPPPFSGPSADGAGPSGTADDDFFDVSFLQ